MTRYIQLQNTMFLASGILLLAGCGSSTYKLVNTEAVKPAAAMGLSATDAGLEFSVTALVVYDSPGAWKKQAYWDEYNVSLFNRSTEPVTVATFELTDVLDRQVLSGEDPWALEKAGRQHEKYLKSLHAPADAFASARQRAQQQKSVAEGAASVAGGVVGLAAASLITVPMAPVFAAATVGLVAYVPVVMVNKWLIDPKNRELVQTAFNRRRLKLPIELAPGASVTGSVFFPITPGPERIAARGNYGSVPLGAIVELPGLEGLHFTYVPDKSALKAAALSGGTLFDAKHPIPERKVVALGNN